MVTSGQRPNLDALRKITLSACIAYHGSEEYFSEFDEDRDAYEDHMLCLSASPLVAACYGRNVYVCTVLEARLLKISVREWFKTSHRSLARWQQTDLDGLLIEPLPLLNDETEATFCAPMVALWNTSKCRIATRVRQERIIDSEEVAEFLTNQISAAAIRLSKPARTGALFLQGNLSAMELTALSSAARAAELTELQLQCVAQIGAFTSSATPRRSQTGLGFG